MKAVLIQKGDEFWENGKLVSTVNSIRHTGGMIYIRYSIRNGGEGTSIFYPEDDTPLTAAQEEAYK